MPPRFPILHTDSRLLPKEVVIGARTASGAVAFRKESLAREKIIKGRIATNPAIAVYDERLSAGYVYHAPDGFDVTYRDGNLIVDGDAYAPDELPLKRINAFEVMWFAWYGFFPETAVIDSPVPLQSHPR